MRPMEPNMESSERKGKIMIFRWQADIFPIVLN